MSRRGFDTARSSRRCRHDWVISEREGPRTEVVRRCRKCARHERLEEDCSGWSTGFWVPVAGSNITGKQVLLLQDSRRLGHHGSSAVIQNIIRELSERGCSVLSHHEQPVGLQQLSSQYSAVVVNGEVSLHSGQPAARAIAEAARACQAQGVPGYLINTVFDETDRDIVEALHGFTRIYARETVSRERMAVFGLQAEVCPDLSLCTPITPAWAPGGRVVVTDSTMSRISAALHAFARENDLEFLTLRTMPEFAPGRRYLFSARRRIGRWFPDSYRLSKYASSIANSSAFFRRMALGTRLVVAARFHSVCFCLKMGIPFLALPSRTHKVEAMLKDAGLEHRLLHRLDAHVLASKAVWSDDDEDKRLAYLRSAQSRITAMFDAIASEVREPLLTDHYPVYAGYRYIADGKAIVSPATGTVADLKSALGLRRVMRFEILPGEALIAAAASASRPRWISAKRAGVM